MKQYGISKFKKIKSKNDIHYENIVRKGYSVIKGVLSGNECELYSELLEKVYKEQLQEFEEDKLKVINEQDVVRMPFIYENEFIKLIILPKILEVVKLFLGENFILQLQNGIINRPGKEHHQTSWHRDIPYQEYITSSPIAINVFYCLTPFNKETGGTILLPYSHLFPTAPSMQFFTENSVQPELESGDVIVFNSWVYHRAGYNKSKIVRYGINHLYTVPIIKQQIDIPKALNGKYFENKELRKILGYDFEVPETVLEYRKKRLMKLKKDL